MRRTTSNAPKRADYGIDAPGVLLWLAGGGLLCGALALLSPSLRGLYSPALSLLLTSAVWLYSSLIGKRGFRHRLMDTLTWRGDERVLDVGCGSGLLLNAAAKRLTTGEAVGVDIWSQKDLADNRKDKTLLNAQIEGVADRVRVEDGDVRALPFGDAAFDFVVSLNVLHNIDRREEREKALSEIVRVLKPDGRLVLCDFRNTGEYVRYLKKIGIPDARRSCIGWILFIPMLAATGGMPSIGAGITGGDASLGSGLRATCLTKCSKNFPLFRERPP